MSNNISEVLALSRRFWSKVAATGNVCECWIWRGHVNHGGYGDISVSKPINTTRIAHKIAYELTIGAVPDGLTLDHLCRETLCVNPWHLEPVTNWENNRRGTSWTWKASITHCPSGHEYTADNTYMNSGKWRNCKKCKRDSVRRSRLRARSVLR